MADTDTILEAGAAIDIAPYQQGLNQMVEGTQAAAAQVNTSFQSLAAADAGVSKAVQSMSEKTAEGFAHVRASGIFGFDAVRAKMVEATAEVARLRNEIQQTDDPAALAKLRAQLRGATDEMTAARTEFRALRFEATEATEKMNLLGEAVGVRLPGEFGRLLGRLPGVQAAMAAAFQIGVVLFFIQMISEAIDKVEELSKEIGGFGKAAEAAYQAMLRENTSFILKNIELREKLDEVALVGKTGATKYAEAVKLSQEAAAAQAAELGRVNRALNEANDEVDKYKKKAAIADTWVSATEGIVNYKEKLEEAEHRVENLKEEQRDLQEKLQFERPARTARERAEEEARQREAALAEEVAGTEARKKVNTDFIDYYVAGVKRLFAENRLTLDEEVADERAAVLQKLQVERDYAAAREAELRRKGATGAEVGPELTALATQRTAAELKARTELAEIDARFDRQTVDHANSVSLALAQASRQAVELEATFAAEAARRHVQTRQTSVEEETAVLRDSLNRRLDAERDVAQEELRIAGQRPYENAARIVELNAQLAEIERRRVAETTAIEEEGLRQQQERQRRKTEEEIRFARETSNLLLETVRRADEQRLKSHAISLSEWEANERGALDRWYAAQRDTFGRALEEARRMFGAQSLEYRKMLNDLAVLDQRYAADRQRIDDRVAAQFQQSMNVISRSFTSAFDRMLTEHTRFGAVMADFWNQMVQGWARMGLQIVADYVQALARILLQEILTAARVQVVHAQTVSAKQATENLYDAFLNLLGIRRAGKETAQAVAEATTNKAAYATDAAAKTAAEAAKTTAVVAGAAARTVAETTAAATIAAAETASRTAEGAVTAAKDVGEVISLAAVGAAGAAAAAAPLGPGAMAAAAAAAEGIILGFIPQAAVVAEKGAFVTADTPAFLHKNETVLPAPLSLGLKNLVDVGGLAPAVPNVLSAPAGASPASSVTNVTHKTMTVSPRVTVNQHGDAAGQMSEEDIAHAVNKGIRRGLVDLRRAL